MEKMCNCNQGRLPCDGRCLTSTPDEAGVILGLMGAVLFVAILFSLIGVLLK